MAGQGPDLLTIILFSFPLALGALFVVAFGRSAPGARSDDAVLKRLNLSGLVLITIGIPVLFGIFGAGSITPISLVGLMVGIPTALLSAIVASFAEKRGKNWFLFLWLSVLFSPLIMGLIVAFTANDQSPNAASGSITQSDSLDKLERLAKLKDSGAISEAEYEDKKRALLDEV